MVALPHDSVSSYFCWQTSPTADKSMYTPLYHLIVLDIVVVTVNLPELKWREEERSDGLSNDKSRDI